MVNGENAKPWFQWPEFGLAPGDRALVIGGGIAGATAAHCLGEKGIDVDLLEREHELARGTSGNPAAVILPVISVKPNPLSLFYQQAYLRILDQLERMTQDGLDVGWRPTGVVHLLAKRRLRERFDRLVDMNPSEDIVCGLAPEETAGITGLPLNEESLFYRRGGVVSPQKLTRAFAAHPKIRLRLGTMVEGLVQDGETWLAVDGMGNVLAKGKAVICANAFGIHGFSQTQNIPMAKVRGQLALVPVKSIPTSPKTVVCHRGFMVPDCDGFHLLGATWNRQNQSTELEAGDQDQLLAEAGTFIPGFQINQSLPLRGRVGFRAQCGDRLPVVGPVPDHLGFQSCYRELHHGKCEDFEAPPFHRGLYFSVAHGSRGMVSALLSGELLAQKLTGCNPTLASDLIEAVHPARFLIRDLKKHPDHRLWLLD